MVRVYLYIQCGFVILVFITCSTSTWFPRGQLAGLPDIMFTTFLEFCLEKVSFIITINIVINISMIIMIIVTIVMKVIVIEIKAGKPNNF